MKGICFKEPLFHAVIERRKTQTRREIASKALDQLEEYWSGREFALAQRVPEVGVSPDETSSYANYKIGEILYLKEPYYISENCPVLYKYDRLPEYNDIVSKGRNKLFMPEKYARYFIEITAVKCESLQDISDKDCMREGIRQSLMGGYCVNIDSVNFDTPRAAYAALIDEISGAGTGENNHGAWVYDFELLEKAGGK